MDLEEKLDFIISRLDILDTIESKLDSMELRFDVMESKLDSLESGFEVTESRFDAVDARFDSVETKLEAVASETGAMDTGFETMETRLNAMDARTETIKQELDAMDARFEKLSRGVRDIGLTLQNETNKNIMHVAEGYLDLVRKLDETRRTENEKEMLVMRVNTLENELRRVKEQLGNSEGI